MNPLLLVLAPGVWGTFVDLISSRLHLPPGEKARDCYGKETARQQQIGSLRFLQGSKQTTGNPCSEW